MKKIYKFIFVGLFGMVSLPALAVPLTGTKNIPGDYPTLAAAITDLNAQGVGAGGVIINLLAANPETAPAAGYVIGGATSLVITTSSAANPVTIQGNGNIITASAALTPGVINDAVFKVIGADYITITGFSINENALNTVTAGGTNNMVEFGIAQFYVTVTDGAQNNTYSGNTITLNRIYQNTFGIFSDTKTSSTSVSTAADATAASGANSNTKVYGNNISNVKYGIVFLGTTTAGAFETGNDIGGSSAATGNTITNWGNTTASSTYLTLTGSNYCIFDNHQVNENVSYNTITSAALTNNITTGGILKNFSTTQPTGLTFTSSYTNNTITVTNAATAAAAGSIIGLTTQGISPQVAGATVNITNNTIQNCVLNGSTSTTNTITCIFNTCAAGTLNITGNSALNNTTAATTSTSGSITGITSSGACGTINITGNTISGNNVSTGTTAGLAGISCSGVSGTVNITTNSLINNGITSATSTSGTITAIGNSGNSATVNLNSNILRGFTSTSLTGQMQGIINTGLVTVAVNMNNNQLGNALGDFFTNNVASTGALFACVNAGGTVATALSIQNNDIRGIVYNGAAASSPNIISSQATNTFSHNISNNTFTNLSIHTTGSVLFIVCQGTLPAGGSKTINNNSIAGTFNKTAAGNTVIFYLDASGSSPAGTISSNQNNNFSNVTVTGATAIIGWDNQDGLGTTASVKTISNNTFSNITGGTGAITTMIYGWGGTGSTASNNVIDNVTGGGFVTGVLLTGNNATGTDQSFSQNRISNLTSTGDTVIAIREVSGAIQNIFKNKIYNLQTNSVGPGGFVSAFWGNIPTGSGGTTTAFYNNLIGNLTAPNISSANAIRALYLASTEAATAFNVSDNTVYMNAASTGTDFGTAAIYQLASATATTNAMTLTDNAFVNNSVSSGTGFTTALQRSSNDFTNFVATSNNNDYYAGTPSATNLIYADGTNADQTLAAYQTAAAPRDAASITENPPFISTTGSNPGFLHIPNAAVTLLANAGVPVAGITDDYDGNARDIATPDIGADEFSFTVVAVRLQYFTGAKQGTSNLLTWKLNGAVNENVVLQRSTDGVNFSPIYASLLTAANSGNPLDYTDLSPAGTKDYYRLKITEASGRVSYSNIVVLLNGTKGTEISVAPTVNNGTFNLNASSVKAGTMIVMIMDMSGQIVSKQIVTIVAGFNNIGMNVSNLAAGTYRIIGTNEDGKTNVTTFIKK